MMGTQWFVAWLAGKARSWWLDWVGRRGRGG